MRSFMVLLLLVVPMHAVRAQGVAPGLDKIMVSYAENPNDYNSQVSGTSVFRFNDLPTGISSNVSWSGVGTFDTLKINNADIYGGAVDAGVAGRYIVQRSGTGNVASTTLTLNTPSAYFGLWWSAGDVNNTIKFYSGSTLIVTFNTSTLLNVIAGNAAYKGNPRNRAWNSTQSYAFLNFFAMNGATWDRIVFSNAVNNTAFEGDNYTTRVAAFDPLTEGSYPGIVFMGVPEPATALAVLAASPLLLRRKRRS